MTVHPGEPVLRLVSDLSVERGISLLCSSRGCRESAVWGLRWNNPKLHTVDRRKTWLACDQHRESLQQFLSLRGFLRETVPVSELPPA